MCKCDNEYCDELNKLLDEVSVDITDEKFDINKFRDATKAVKDSKDSCDNLESKVE